jgi:hypothetical protein
VSSNIANAAAHQEDEGPGASSLPQLVDCRIMDQAVQGVSDHCPIMLVLARI